MYSMEAPWRLANIHPFDWVDFLCLSPFPVYTDPTCHHTSTPFYSTVIATLLILAVLDLLSDLSASHTQTILIAQNAVRFPLLSKADNHTLGISQFRINQFLSFLFFFEPEKQYSSGWHKFEIFALCPVMFIFLRTAFKGYFKQYQLNQVYNIKGIYLFHTVK